MANRVQILKHTSFVVISVLILIFSIIGLYRIRTYPAMPVQYTCQDGQMIISGFKQLSLDQPEYVCKGGAITAMDGHPVRISSDISFYYEKHSIGDTLTVQFISQEHIESSCTFLLEKKYGPLFFYLNLILGVLFWGVGNFVYLKKSDDPTAIVFTLLCLFMTAAILVVWPMKPSTILNYILAVFYLITYPLAIAMIIQFTVIYPTKKSFVAKFPILQHAFSLISVVFSLLLISLYTISYLMDSPVYFKWYFEVYDLFRWYVISGYFFTLVFISHSFVGAKTLANRLRSLWLLFGFSMGSLPFLFLWTLPLLFKAFPIIPEEVNYVFLSFIPLSFAISIIRYQAFDIQVIVQRGIIYTLVTGVIIFVYLAIVGVAGNLFYSAGPQDNPVLAIFGTLIAALIFTPIKNRVQKIVDRAFYRITYDYQKVFQDFMRQLSQSKNQEDVVNILVSVICSAIPVEFAQLYGKNKIIFRLLGQKNLKPFKRKHLPREILNGYLKIIGTQRKPLANTQRADVINARQIPQKLIRKNWPVALIIPIFLQEELIGLFVAGEKLSRMGFYKRDVDLMTDILAEGYMTLERLRLYEAMILEREEKQRHEALSKMKSEFISHVSHELRTPLTFINWSLANLVDGIPMEPPPSILNYLKEIYSSSQNLEGMIEKLLNMSRIEAGRIEPIIAPLNISEEVQNVLKILAPIAAKRSIQTRFESKETIWVNADYYHTRTVLTNLIENAIKYTIEGDGIIITLQNRDKDVVVCVEDHGPGIPEDMQQRIFGEFERIQSEGAYQPGGLGLGLHIVKKLLELQDGTIWLESKERAGTRFYFSLPRSEEPVNSLNQLIE